MTSWSGEKVFWKRQIVWAVWKSIISFDYRDTPKTRTPLLVLLESSKHEGSAPSMGWPPREERWHHVHAMNQWPVAEPKNDALFFLKKVDFITHCVTWYSGLKQRIAILTGRQNTVGKSHIGAMMELGTWPEETVLKSILTYCANGPRTVFWHDFSFQNTVSCRRLKGFPIVLGFLRQAEMV